MRVKFSKLCLAYIGHISQIFPKNTFENYRTDILQFSKFISTNKIPTSRIFHPPTIEMFLSTFRNSGRTRNRKLSVLRSFFSYCKDKIPSIKDPFTHIKTIKVNNVKETLPYLLKDRFLPVYIREDALSIRNSLIIYFLYECGLKTSELCNLKMDNIDTQLNLMHILNEDGYSRSIKLSDTAVKMFQQYTVCRNREEVQSPFVFYSKKGEKLTRKSVWRLVNAYGKSRGIGVCPNILRNSFASNIASEKPLDQLRTILGHRDIETTKRLVSSVRI